MSNKLSNAITAHFNDLFFQGGWTGVNLKDVLADVTLYEANTVCEGFNSVAQVTNHLSYYYPIQLKVFRGGDVEGHDSESWKIDAPKTEEEWRDIVSSLLDYGREMIAAIEGINDGQMFAGFDKSGKYGTVQRNLIGIIEHTYYHLGQIVILKKLVRQSQSN